jgi:hypothetical protein
MNFKAFFEKNWHYLAIVASFIVIGFLYFSPILTGKDLPQMDNIHAQAMAHELEQYREQTGKDALWTNSMFGGMPAYQIKGATSHSIFLYLNRFLRLGLPYSTVALVFLYLLGFYVLLRSLKIETWISLAGAAAFAFASYNIIIIGAGHVTKAYAIAFMAPSLAGIILLYREKWWAGSLLTLLGLGMEVASNHPQISYYLALVIITLMISEFVFAIINKHLARYFKTSALVIGLGLLSVAPNITSLWTTYEYSKDTTRGGSELSVQGEKNKATGLDKDYALSWSYGLSEIGTILIPNFHGGSSSVGFDDESYTYSVLKKMGEPNPERITQYVAYWGDMPFTSGPVYFGAVFVFFFVLGLFVVENRSKWWILVATLLSVFLAFGKNWMGFTDLFFYYVPFYNKFRTVSMILVIANVLVVLMGSLALKAIYDGRAAKEDLKRYATISFAIVGGFSLIFAIMPGVFFDFKSVNDPANLPDWLKSAIYADREVALRADAFRSLVYSVLSFGIAWLLIDGKIRKNTFGVILIAIVIFDLWTVDKRYVNNEQFVSKRVTQNQFTPTQADQLILKDLDKDFRVLNLTRNPWSDAYTSYFHKSIGGYHGAKLSRYQDLIDRQLSRNNTKVLNMLNTKYYITANQNTGQTEVNINFEALGNAWFVNEVELVDNPDKEMDALTTFNPARTAVVDKRYKKLVDGLKTYDYYATDTGKIVLTKYAPDNLVYESTNTNEQLAVFSEIYYDKGWDVYVDGVQKEYLRANYVLRALRIPAGKHMIEWKFEPKSHEIAQLIATISSIIVLLLMLFLGFKLVKTASTK